MECVKETAAAVRSLTLAAKNGTICEHRRFNVLVASFWCAIADTSEEEALPIILIFIQIIMTHVKTIITILSHFFFPDSEGCGYVASKLKVKMYSECSLIRLTQSGMTLSVLNLDLLLLKQQISI